MKSVLFGIMALTVTVFGGRPAIAQETSCNSGTYEGAHAGEVVIPQNWTCEDRQLYWFTDQGSQIMPYVWFLHLEQADSTDKFGAPENMNRLGYLPQSPTSLNPDGLAIGFTRGTAKSNADYARMSDAWLGMNCAACHTGQVEYNGLKYLIDGAPTMGDFEGLLLDMIEAMQATLADDEKFDRFAKAVLAENQERGLGGATSKSDLRSQFLTMARIRQGWNDRNMATEGSPRYGHGRLDALGAIFNETAGTALGNAQNVKPANAPVSYPFVWDTPQHDKVQWNGSVPNAGLGSLSRNIGEVLGVFGSIDFNRFRYLRTGHKTSVDVGGLATLENLIWKLQSPLWSDTGLPVVDPVKLVRGKAVYEQYCSSCHINTMDRADPDRRIKARMFPIFNPKNQNDPDALGTDPVMAMNFLKRTAAAEKLTGRYTRYLRILSKAEKFPAAQEQAVPQIKVVGYSVAGTIVREIFTNRDDIIRALRAGRPEDRAERIRQAAERLPRRALNLTARGIEKFLDSIGDDPEGYYRQSESPKCFPDGVLPCYKARPLNGIWATAPYLHNGSVRTMRQLLLPVSERQTTFRAGSREFDPNDIGFRDEGPFVFDTSIPGNSNAGHDGPRYGNAELAKSENADDLEALLEYLKSL